MFAGMSRHFLIAAIVLGVLLGVGWTLAPVALISLAAGAWLVVRAGRGLPDGERRLLTAILSIALAARLLVILGLFATGGFDNQGATMMFGDEGQAMRRALRVRNLWLGNPGLQFDVIDAFDAVGWTIYLDWLAAVQLVFGPSAHGIRIANVVLFLTAGLLAFRLSRRAFGALPAFSGLIVLVSLPSLFVWSISLLKESLYLLAAVVAIAASVAALRTRGLLRRCGAIAAAMLAVWALDGMRAGGATVALAALAVGFVGAAVCQTPRRIIAASAAGALLVCLLYVPRVQALVTPVIESGASRHLGHAFTIGHAYRLLDPELYTQVQFYRVKNIELTPDEAARFTLRAFVSFVTVPLPWEIASRAEAAYLAEHVIWWLLVALVPFGLAGGIRRDPLVTWLFAGMVLVNAAAVALNSGNVGTLIRHRALVTPFLVWLSALGACVLLEAIGRRARIGHPSPAAAAAQPA